MHTDHGDTAGDQLAAASTVLRQHVTALETGRCVKCGSRGPCWRRENALVTFSRTLRLPSPALAASSLQSVDAARVGFRELRSGQR